MPILKDSPLMRILANCLDRILHSQWRWTNSQNHRFVTLQERFFSRTTCLLYDQCQCLCLKDLTMRWIIHMCKYAYIGCGPLPATVPNKGWQTFPTQILVVTVTGKGSERLEVRFPLPFHEHGTKNLKLKPATIFQLDLSHGRLSLVQRDASVWVLDQQLIYLLQLILLCVFFKRNCNGSQE